MRGRSSGRKPETGEPCARKRASTGSGRGGEKRAERQRARRLLHQKNGAIVRQVIGYDRLEGECAYRQLGEVYQALRLYVNGFQPSMKLQTTQYDGRKVRRVYDAAKTPLQRLLLSKVLSASKEQEVLRVAQVLDPLRLFQHLQDLQQALFGSDTSTAPHAEGSSPMAVFPFCVERCLSGRAPAAVWILEESWLAQVLHERVPDPISPGQPEQETEHHVPATAAGAGCSSVTLAQQPEVKRVTPASTNCRGGNDEVCGRPKQLLAERRAASGIPRSYEQYTISPHALDADY